MKMLKKTVLGVTLFFGVGLAVSATANRSLATERVPMTMESLEDIKLCDLNLDEVSGLRALILTAYPVGSAAGKFAKYIKKLDGIEIIWDKNDFNFGKLGLRYAYVFKARCERQNINKDVWIFSVVSDIEDKISLIGVDIKLDDEDFSLRNIGFKFEYFESEKSTTKALKSIIKEDGNRVSIAKIMNGAGAVLRNKEKYDSPTVEKYEQPLDKDNIWLRFVPSGGKTYSFEFDEQGVLINFY